MGGLFTTGRFVPSWRARSARFGVRQRGFTIVEVMIVFAVSGALFVAAALLINGKQNQAAFNQSTQQIRAQIQQVMNEVAIGFFPDNANFRCTAAPGGPMQLTTAGASEQGSNAGCIFAGKAMQFKVSGGTNPERFNIFTLAGLQKNGSGNEVTSLSEAAPRVIAPAVGSPANFPDLTIDQVLQNGLTTATPTSPGATAMWYNNGGSDVNIGAVAFVPSFAQYGGTGLNSGSQRISVVAITGTSLNASKASTATAINTNLASGVVDPTGGISLCFASGGTNQSALVTIGGSRGPLSVTHTVMQGTQTCGK